MKKKQKLIKTKEIRSKNRWAKMIGRNSPISLILDFQMGVVVFLKSIKNVRGLQS